MAQKPLRSRTDPAGGHTPPENVLASIHVLSSRISQAFVPEIEQQFGLTLAEWRVMLTVATRPNVPASQITELWAVDKMSVSRAVRRLDEKGFLSRRADPGDRRVSLLSLTDAGRRKYDDVLPTANARYREIVSVLAEDEFLILMRALDKMLGGLSEADEAEPAS